MFPAYLVGQFENIDVAGTAGQTAGQARFVAPFSGYVNKISISTRDAAEGLLGTGQFRFKISTDAGDTYEWAIDTGSYGGTRPAGDPIQLDVDPSARESLINSVSVANYCRAGEGFTIQSNGDGATGGWSGCVVEFMPGGG